MAHTVLRRSWVRLRMSRACDRAAAEAIAWGLMDRKTSVLPVGDTSQGALGEAFRFLTGVDAVNDGSVPSPHPTKLMAVPTPSAAGRPPQVRRIRPPAHQSVQATLPTLDSDDDRPDDSEANRDADGVHRMCTGFASTL
jgi:hypothetical protein